MVVFGPYTPVRQAGNYYFVSGQVGIDPQTKEISPDVVEQTHQVLKNMRTLLEENGLQLNDVAKTTVFLKNMEDFAAVNEVYTAYFDNPRPARSCIGVSELPNVAATEILIEIEATAYKNTETNNAN